jgi:recombination protein RecT
MSGAVQLRTEQDLKLVLAKEYQKTIENYFGDKDKALEFLTNVVAAVQRTPKLLECTPATLLNSFMVMASLKLMPSGISGEAYVLPYANKGQMEAQFQLGYQGLVTLFYRAGARSIVAEIVRENDVFSFLNGEVHHAPDVFSESRGAAVGAYVIVELQFGGTITKAMSKKDILGIGEKFSKSFKSDFTPWNEKNDPELWMWKKTVLKQAAKLVPKNETIHKALAADNKDNALHPLIGRGKPKSSVECIGVHRKRGSAAGCACNRSAWAGMASGVGRCRAMDTPIFYHLSEISSSGVWGEADGLVGAVALARAVMRGPTLERVEAVRFDVEGPALLELVDDRTVVDDEETVG